MATCAMLTKSQDTLPSIENYAGSREFDVLSAYILTAAEKHASSAANMPDQKPDDVGVNPTGKVVQLTADTFDSKVARSKEPWWIQMYTPWCKHCSQLAPTWDQLATELKGHANVASINCESSKGKLDSTFCGYAFFGPCAYKYIYYRCESTLLEARCHWVSNYQIVSFFAFIASMTCDCVGLHYS
jgi:thiol-disulfide isomerase/thioredoxin